MQFKDAQDTLLQNGQGRVLRFWDRLEDEERSSLLAQIEAIDFGAVERMRLQLAANLKGDGGGDGEIVSPISPAPVLKLAGDALTAAIEIGEAELRAGKVAALLVAGGQGSRLGYEGPKGCYGIGPASDASLFYFHARKILALSRRYGKPVPIYIMTSESNDAQTRAFFVEHKFFGLDEADVFFFVQSMWPALDEKGEIILESPSRISLAADGHGGTISALAASGGLADMKRRGIETVFFFQVDNPLVDVCSPAFIGFHKQHGADVTAKVCEKSFAMEKVGMPVARDGKALIVEYTEFTEEQQNERLPGGELRFNYGSVNILVFNVSFLESEAGKNLPLHIQFKQIAAVDDSKPKKPNGYKFEKFIFDALADADVTRFLAFDRADEFAPVKNATGVDSAETCKAALVAKWRRWLAAAGVNTAENAVIEIDPVFADSQTALIGRLRENKTVIDANAKTILLQM